MKAVIFGVGRMGTAIAYAMEQQGYDVVGVDSQPAEHRLRGLVKNYKFVHTKTKTGYKKVINDNPDVVISSLPYHQTKQVAEYCISKGVRYCDLGGRVDVSQEINELALKKATKPVFTDLGLAPGWVNILAEEGYKRVSGSKDTSIEMMVGGIPAQRYNNDTYNNPNYNPLNYIVTWSVDGLINEYRDDCIVLQNGTLKTVAGMDGLETLDTQLGELEAFYTSGGAAHSIKKMKERGVKNCTYKTLRYPGHRDFIQWLIRQCELDDDTLKELFSKGFDAKDEKDCVIVRAKVVKGRTTWLHEQVVNADDKFSAMQKSTAFPIASVAALMAEGVFDSRVKQNRSGDIKLPNALVYSDIPHDLFNFKLQKLLK